MIKQSPSPLRLAAMALFTLSCIGLLMWLWLSFGGPIPLRSEGYRFTVAMPEAATLAKEADVRLAGVNVGKVKDKQLDKRGWRTLVTIELDPRYAPIPEDTQAILRQKSLLGETYVALSPGNESSGDLDDGARLADSQVEPTVELDEIFSAFDRPTRQAFRDWVAELRRASSGRAAESLNDALGNLAPFSVDGAKLLRTLDEQERAVHGLVRNTGEVFGAINEREGALRRLIVSANDVFEATASRDEALAETFQVFPTFLDESKATLARLGRFSRDTHPLVNDLKGPADDLGPTLRDLGDLAPDLEGLFRDLPPLIRTSRTTVPRLRGVLRGAEPVLAALGPFLDELNPILSYFNFNQEVITTFMASPASALAGHEPFGDLIPRNHYLPQIAAIDGRSFERYTSRPPYDRGNAYIAPNAYARAEALGAVETFGSCANTGRGEVRDPQDAGRPGTHAAPPCFVQPRSLLNGRQFPLLGSGKAPRTPAPQGRTGREPAQP
jgi:phospholipid/cholesterol/gamma-HCH transport system substrate-binding protein